MPLFNSSVSILPFFQKIKKPLRLFILVCYEVLSETILFYFFVTILKYHVEKNKLRQSLQFLPSKGYQYAHSLNNYFDNNPDDELYVNQNGEYAYRFTLDKTTTFKVPLMLCGAAKM